LREATPQAKLAEARASTRITHHVVYLYLIAGGALGTLARYELGRWMMGWERFDYPWHTLAINLSGSFVLGAFVRATQAAPLQPELRALVAIGFCGAFTTFSTFTLETVEMLQEGMWQRALAYSAGSVLLGVLAVMAGMAALGSLLPAPR
jgi:CrcB protein